MLKTLGIFLAVAVASSSFGHVQAICNGFVETVDISALPGLQVTIGGGLYGTVEELHFNPYQSRYYACRMANALGYGNAKATNTTFLALIDLMTPWSGPRQSPSPKNGIAVDAAFGYKRAIGRFCKFPTATTPFDCFGQAGYPYDATDGDNLGELYYYPILHDEVLHDWTLFAQVWNPNAEDPADRVASWNVFSRKSEIPSGQVSDIINRLAVAGFGNTPAYLIQPDYTFINSD